MEGPQNEAFQASLPRGRDLRIMVEGCEHGYFNEALCVTTDGERSAVYVPVQPVDPSAIGLDAKTKQPWAAGLIAIY